MTQQDFQKYIGVLKAAPFTLYPAVDMSSIPSRAPAWIGKQFKYVDDSEAHVIIQDTASDKTYYIPLVLVEFANPGVLRLTRALKPDNGNLL
jgi:hypothetical protein